MITVRQNLRIGMIAGTHLMRKGRDLEGYLILPKEAQNARDIHLEVTVWKDTDDGPIPFITEFDLSV